MNSVIGYLKKLVAGLFNRHAIIDKALAETTAPAKKSPEKFKPLTFCGRRITGETQRKLLAFMLKNPLATRSELDNYLGVQNTPDVVMRMVRNCGWTIQKIDHWRREVGESRKRRHHYYMLTRLDCDIATRMLQMSADSSPPSFGTMAKRLFGIFDTQ